MMSHPINIALLGAGWFGREAHLRNLVTLPGVRVIAASSRSDSSLEAARAIAGRQVETRHDWREILEIDAVDAVVIALTNDLHRDAAVAALEAGKHVLVEKPMALTLRQCDEVIAAGRASGKVLQVGHEMRFQRLYLEMKSLIEAGAVGELHLMWCREFRGPMRAGWRSSEAATGGAILEKNIHHLDLFNWILGSRPLRVAAQGGTDVLTDREVLDNAQVLVEYEGGRRATLELCLFAPVGGDCEIGVAGSAGRIDTKNQALSLVHQAWDPPARVERKIPESGEEATFTDASGRVDRGIRAELAHFIDCILTNKPPLNDGPSARLAVAICLAAQESIRRHEFVELEELM